MDGLARSLPWEHCLNARELGGLPTVHGERTQPGRLVRSDTLSRLTAEGRRQLLAYGIRTVIDLRRPAEASAEPHDFMSRSQSVEYLNLPLEKYFPQVSDKIKKAKSRGEVYCIIADHYPWLTAAVMRAIGNAPPGGVLIHCHSGKDRTGMIAALALRLVGVPAATVIDDYALSQRLLLAEVNSTPTEWKHEDQQDFWSQPTATSEMMTMYLDHLDSRYGGARAYLTAAGMSAGEMEAVRDRLLRP